MRGSKPKAKASDMAAKRQREIQNLRKRHNPRREMSPAMLEALRHPARRQILRELHVSDVAISPVELANVFPDWPTASLAFHFRVLEEMRIARCLETQRVRGATKHLFVSNVKRNKLVSAILEETEKADRPLFVRVG
jgi:hypothetical protein